MHVTRALWFFMLRFTRNSCFLVKILEKYFWHQITYQSLDDESGCTSKDFTAKDPIRPTVATGNLNHEGNLPEAYHWPSFQEELMLWPLTCQAKGFLRGLCVTRATLLIVLLQSEILVCRQQRWFVGNTASPTLLYIVTVKTHVMQKHVRSFMNRAQPPRVGRRWPAPPERYCEGVDQ